MTYTYKLFEDNAGALHLAVLDHSGACVYYLADADRAFVLSTLADLTSGGDPIADGWEGGADDPAAAYQEITGFVDLRNGSAREIDDSERWRMVYDLRCGIVRDAAGYAQRVEPCAYWWNAPASDDMPIYKIGGALYCATGWNGESYLHSFRVLDRLTAADSEEHILRPIYRYQDEDRQPDEDNDDDFEIIGFEID